MNTRFDYDGLLGRVAMDDMVKHEMSIFVSR